MTDTLITDPPDIEHWPTWTTDLFLCTNPYHEMLKQPVCAAIKAHRDQSQQAVASQVAVSAKHALFESELDFLESDDADLQTLRQLLTDLVLECAASVNEPYWPDDAQLMQAMGVSWNLQTLSNRIVIAQDHYSPGVIEQFYKRVYRKGQQRTTYLDFLTSNHPLDRVIAKMRAQREASQRRALDI